MTSDRIFNIWQDHFKDFRNYKISLKWWKIKKGFVISNIYRYHNLTQIQPSTASNQGNQTSRAIRTLHYMKRKHTHLTQQTRINIYNLLIRSSLTYATPSLLNITKQKLEITHRKSIRVCLKPPRSAPHKILAPLSGTTDINIHYKSQPSI